MNKPYLLILLLFFAATACNVEKENAADHQIAATINGEEWYFYNAEVSPTDNGGTTLTAQGYLLGDQGTEPATLNITFVGLPGITEEQEGYTASFAPTSNGKSAFATLTFPERNWQFDTKLDTEAQGTFTIEAVEENLMNGTFDFVVKDQAGNSLDLESADFTNVRID